MWILAAIFWCSLAAALPQKEDVANISVEIKQNLFNGIDNFTTKLIHVLYDRATPNSNVLLSPINVYNALSFLMLGSTGGAYDELSAVLGLPKTADKFLLSQAGLRDLIKSLELIKYDEPSMCADFSATNPKPNCTYEDVTFANALFLQKDLLLSASYIEKFNTYGRGAAENVDFKDDALGATNKINKWVAEKTRNLILNLYQLPIHSDVRIMLTSTVYFSAKWPLGLFKAFRWPEDDFFTEDEIVKVDYIFNENKVNYCEDELLYQAIQLPYRDEDFVATFILPNANITVKDFAKNFTVDDLKKITKKFKPIEVAFQIPCLDIGWSSDLVEPLKLLNLSKVFSSIDLSNMISTNSSCLEVSKVSHATRLKMDEEGTVASGATAIEIEDRWGSNNPPIEFIVNRPFLFFITHKESSVVIFSALVRNPKVK